MLWASQRMDTTKFVKSKIQTQCLQNAEVMFPCNSFLVVTHMVSTFLISLLQKYGQDSLYDLLTMVLPEVHSNYIQSEMMKSSKL